MNEEEIIRICKLICGTKNKKGKREYNTIERMNLLREYNEDTLEEAIEGLLDLYQKEKEKNKKAQNELQKYNKRGQTLANYMKDKNLYMYKTISKNWIEKNKIKEIIKLTTQNKEIVKLPNNETICVSDCYELLNYLQELLKEGEDK